MVKRFEFVPQNLALMSRFQMVGILTKSISGICSHNNLEI